MNISATPPDSAIVQSITFEICIDALIISVASMAANISHRFATVVEEMDIDGSHYMTNELAECTPGFTYADYTFSRGVKLCPHFDSMFKYR